MSVLRMGVVIPGGNATLRRLAAELSQHTVGFVQNISLLLNGHVFRVLVRVSVKSDFVAGVPDRRHLLWEGLQGVTGNEPGRFDTVLVEHL